MKVKKFEFPTLQHAWAGLNKYLANEQEDIEKYGGGVYSSEMVLHNSVIHVEKAWVDPEFDFAYVLGYTDKKWSKLVSNYVDMAYLDLLKSDVLGREKVKARSYTFAFHFSNKHKSGKDCLISLTFTRGKTSENPVVYYHTRAMECTKRVIFDFLLIQRIIEYVYGPRVTVEVIMYIPYMFVTQEGWLLYTNYEPIQQSITNHKNPNLFQKRILSVYDKLINTDINSIKYKVHARSAKGIQRDSKGHPIHGRINYKAKDITLINPGKLKSGLINKLDKSK